MHSLRQSHCGEQERGIFRASARVPEKAHVRPVRCGEPRPVRPGDPVHHRVAGEHGGHPLEAQEAGGPSSRGKTLATRRHERALERIVPVAAAVAGGFRRRQKDRRKARQDGGGEGGRCRRWRQSRGLGRARFGRGASGRGRLPRNPARRSRRNEGRLTVPKPSLGSVLRGPKVAMPGACSARRRPPSARRRSGARLGAGARWSRMSRAISSSPWPFVRKRMSARRSCRLRESVETGGRPALVRKPRHGPFDLGEGPRVIEIVRVKNEAEKGVVCAQQSRDRHFAQNPARGDLPAPRALVEV